MTAPNAGDPSALTIPGGAQYLQAPDGTSVPTIGDPLTNSPGTPKDVTGVPLTAAPRRTGNNATVLGAGAPTPNSIVVGGLYNVRPDDAGAAALVLANTAIVTPGQPPPNTGIYLVTTVISSTSVVAAKFAPLPPFPVFPDVASGQIAWVVFKLDEFAEGNPLAYCAELALPLSVVSPQPSAARFANYDPTVPPVVANDSGGLFNKVQRA